ncbi:MAG: hypothetical protein EPN72_10305 [Nevskiaceae bacterium]|nr:MAG: hypothetical protein EPN61_01905 [Burkholderiaceae bacterium]TBR72371.1 MAG: hypothetical protein EPN72_10305 [Nevskiaceae bacterium]
MRHGAHHGLHTQRHRHLASRVGRRSAYLAVRICRTTSDCYVFTSLDEVRRTTEDWLHCYNPEHPHRSLGGLPPVPYAMAQSPQTATSE